MNKMKWALIRNDILFEIGYYLEYVIFGLLVAIIGVISYV